MTLLCEEKPAEGHPFIPSSLHLTYASNTHLPAHLCQGTGNGYAWLVSGVSAKLEGKTSHRSQHRVCAWIRSGPPDGRTRVWEPMLRKNRRGPRRRRCQERREMKSNDCAIPRLIAPLIMIGTVGRGPGWEGKITSSALDKFVAGVGRSTK